MDNEKTRIVKNNWMSFSTLVLLIGFIINQSRWHQVVDDHIVDEKKHYDIEKMRGIFVPRIELDRRLSNIEENQREATDKRDDIYDLLLKMK